MRNQRDPIRGKVARVLNSREIALNIGQQDGVRVGMVFKVLSPNKAEVKDPDTGELLGSVDLEKTRVKVKSVQGRVSVAATYRERRVNVGGRGIGLSVFEPPKWETHVETLSADDAAWEQLGEGESHVKTGDPVVLEPAE